MEAGGRRPLAVGGGIVRGTRRLIGAIAFVGILLCGSGSVAALVDDLEDDFWTSFTHFHLGDRATAGYSTAVARSGTRSYHVEISGWTIRDFGAAYGYGYFATRRSPITELRLSMVYDRLEDTVGSPWDAYAAGVSLDLLDWRLRSVGSVRYVTEYQASRNGGRCGPTTSDAVLESSAGLGEWTDIGRNPAADFPSAQWSSAEFVRISIGFLCAAGLSGASYSLYFDDFLLDTGSGDSDGDGLRDLEEESRIYSMRVASGSVPSDLHPMEATSIDISVPAAAGAFASAGIELQIDHDRVTELSVELRVPDGAGDRTQLLWDPGFHARGAVILAPSDESAVRGVVEVRGMSWRPNPLVQFDVDDLGVASVNGDPSGAFTVSWNSDGWAEGPHRLSVIAQALDDGGIVARPSAVTTVIVDRTPPDLLVLSPHEGETLSGLALIAAGAFDRQGVTAVELWIDGVFVDVRDDLYVFPYETLDLSNELHTFEIRARDMAGNEAVRTVTARVNNNGVAPPPPCSPKCNTGGGTTIGNLPPLLVSAQSRTIPLPSGDRMEVSESFRVPWTPSVVRTERGVHLVLDATRPRTLREADGLIGSDLNPEDFFGGGNWQVVVRDHGEGGGGSIRGLSVLLAFRTFPGISDSDRDGLADGLERGTTATVPVLSDLDGDLLTDGEESGPRALRLLVDGVTSDRVIQTDPFNFDSDDDMLPDGLELFPGVGRNPTDPTDLDTDEDGLLDGAERFTHGSDPTLTDTDQDTLSDFAEVSSRELRMEIDGAPIVRFITTSPTSSDTDQDGIRDDEEWAGESLRDFVTDPADPDTDDDGLSDFDEFLGLNRRPTNPLLSDTDSDRVIDGLDLSPTEYWEFEWKTRFDPGLIRFTQPFRALAVHAISATIWTYRIDDGSCVFLSDHTSDATRSSDESTSTVLQVLNDVLLSGGESNFTATGAAGGEQEGWGTASFAYGECDFFHPRQYRFEYVHDVHRFDISFVNTAEVAIRDDVGDLFYHSALDIPLRLAKPQGVILQFSIHPDADREDDGSGGTTTVPALVYSLFRGREYSTTPPFYQNLAIGIPLDDHAYEFHLRVPSEVATEENVIIADGVPTATLVIMPTWLTSGPSGTMKSALNATRVTVGSTISRVQESAEIVIARLATDMEALGSVLPASAAGLTSGRYSFGTYSVYVYHTGDVFDSGASGAVDAIYFVGGSPEEIATFQDTIVWAPSGAWNRESEDGFGVFLRVFKIIRTGITVTSQIIGRMLVPLLTIPSGNTEQMTFGRSTFVVTKLTNIETGAPYYVVGSTVVQTVKLRVPHPEVPGVMLTEVRTIERELRGEIVDDIDDSRMLTGVKYANLRLAIRGASVGATLAIFGSQAVLAFRDGDIVKGTVFVLAGATATFGIARSDVILIERVFEIRSRAVAFRVKLGTAALIAVTGILASYELFQAGQSDNAIKRLSHYENAGALVVDSMVAAVPLYGAAAMLGWQLGLNIAVGVGALLGIMPDMLALRIVSTPGSTIVFLFEYIFTTEIPSEVAEEALSRLLTFLADAARYNNSLDPAVPTLLLVP
jgi:hypothetical protein